MNINQTFLQQLKLGSAIENLHQKLSVPLVAISFLIIRVLVVREEVPGYFLKTILRLLRSPVANVNHSNTRNGNSNENYDAIKFLELLQSFSLTIHVEDPTHSSGHTLDLIITRKTDNLISSVPRAVCLFSDHMPIFCEIKNFVSESLGNESGRSAS